MNLQYQIKKLFVDNLASLQNKSIVSLKLEMRDNLNVRKKNQNVGFWFLVVFRIFINLTPKKWNTYWYCAYCCY